MNFHLRIFCFLFLLFCSVAGAQSSTYVSSVDADLTIKKWTFFPLADNLDGIYAKPMNEHLRSLMEKEYAFEFVPAVSGIKNAPEDFEEKASLAIDFLKKSNADAFIAGRISKGPQGVTIRMTLFSGANGVPVGTEIRKDLQTFDIEDLKKEITQTFTLLRAKVPYQGIVLSRRGSQVTMNLGERNGVRAGQEILAIQVTKIQRHPRFGFLINVEKEIMGKIRITKVESTLSFGSITSERTDGLIQPGFKLGFDEFVKYAEPARDKYGNVLPALNQRPDAAVAFGQNPQEWAPMNAPSFGKVALLLGFGTYNLSNNLSASGSVSGQSSMTPSFHVEGEMWLSSNWFLSLELHQYATSIDNGLAGSSPGTLSLQTLEAELLGGYNVLVTEEFWGPKLQLMFGMTNMDSKIEGSSPTAFTSNKYGGMALGVAGSIPLGNSEVTSLPITMGGKFIYNWNPSMSEAPVSSGSSSKNSISTFSLFGEYQTSERLAWKGELSFRQYNSNLSGSGDRGQTASSISHAMTTLAGGVVFLF